MKRRQTSNATNQLEFIKAELAEIQRIEAVGGTAAIGMATRRKELEAERQELEASIAKLAFLGRSEGPEDLRGELRKASAAHAACAMLRELLAPMNLPSDKRTHSAWVHGFRHGLAGNHQTMNGAHVPPEVVIEDGNISMDGWLLGYGIRAALAIADGKPDPRQSSNG